MTFRKRKLSSFSLAAPAVSLSRNVCGKTREAAAKARGGGTL